MNTIIFRWFNNLAGQSSLGDALIIFLASYLGWILLAGLAVHFFRRRYRSGLGERFLAIFATAVSAWLIAQAIKYFYPTPRPFTVLSGVRQLLVENTSALPSLHAAFFFALALTLYLYDRRWGNVYLVGVLLVGLARVAAGVHWPIDILAGFGLAVLVTLIFNHVFRFSERQQFRD